jgi:hypothetical protein
VKAAAGRGQVWIGHGDRGRRKIDRSFVSRLLDLTLLAPDIQEAILEGRQPKGLQLEELTRAMPAAWEEQRNILIAVAGRQRSLSSQRP